MNDVLEDDVFWNRDNGGWYFWDESGKFFYGPYVTKAEAQDARTDYLIHNA